MSLSSFSPIALPTSQTNHEKNKKKIKEVEFTANGENLKPVSATDSLNIARQPC